MFPAPDSPETSEENSDVPVFTKTGVVIKAVGDLADMILDCKDFGRPLQHKALDKAVKTTEEASHLWRSSSDDIKKAIRNLRGWCKVVVRKIPLFLRVSKISENNGARKMYSETLAEGLTTIETCISLLENSSAKLIGATVKLGSVPSSLQREFSKTKFTIAKKKYKRRLHSIRKALAAIVPVTVPFTCFSTTATVFGGFSLALAMAIGVIEAVQIPFLRQTVEQAKSVYLQTAKAVKETEFALKSTNRNVNTEIEEMRDVQVGVKEAKVAHELVGSALSTELRVSAEQLLEICETYLEKTRNFAHAE